VSEACTKAATAVFWGIQWTSLKVVNMKSIWEALRMWYPRNVCIKGLRM
jgi:hypothetical protein